MRSLPHSCFVVACVAFAVWCEPAQSGLFFSQGLGASLNPLGVISDSKLLYRRPLVSTPGILWEGTKLEAGFQNEWTPADNLVSARVTLVPVSLLEINFKGGYYRMFDGLGFGCWGFDDSRPDYSDQARKGIDPQDASGLWVSVGPTLRLKVAKVIFLDAVNLNYISLDGSGTYLEVHSYTIHEHRDYDLINNAYLLYEFGAMVMAGVNHQSTFVKRTEARSRRVCAMVVATPKLGWIEHSFFAVTAGIYTEDPLFAGRRYAGLMAGGEWGIAGLGKR